jgi:hypothetical protein
MYLINKFDLEYMTEDQLQVLANFSKLFGDIKSKQAAERAREAEL